MKYEISKLFYQGITIYSLNNIIKIAFDKDNKIDLRLSKPVKNVDNSILGGNNENNNEKYKIDINDAEKYIDADINIIGLLCSCHLIDNK